MEWLTQNWLWIVLVIGGFFLFTRMRGMGGMGGGCGSSHSGNQRRADSGREIAPPAAGNHPGNLFDPVSRRTFAAGNMPLSAAYGGRAYYFESRENRDAFEADPEKYVAASAPADDVIPADREADRPRRRRGGC